MKTHPDITLTLVGDDFDGYRVSTQTESGASFISAHVPNLPPNGQLPAADARNVAAKAERCALVVRIE